MDALKELDRVETTPTEKMGVEEPSTSDILLLPNGKSVVKVELLGKDFFNFQRQVLKNSDAVEGMQALMLKAFRWADGSRLTIDQINDEFTFEDCSFLSDHLTALFGKGQADKTSLPPAKS